MPPFQWSATTLNCSVKNNNFVKLFHLVPREHVNHKFFPLLVVYICKEKEFATLDPQTLTAKFPLPRFNGASKMQIAVLKFEITITTIQGQEFVVTAQPSR